MSWASRTQPIKVGDRVCYSRRFLQSISCFTGDMPQGRGTVIELKPIGQTTLAVIDWHGMDLPEKVNTAKLSRCTEKGIMDHD
jgi:hypothetical protein